MGLPFGNPSYDDFDSCLKYFVGLFADFLRSVLKDKNNEANLLVKEYICLFSAGIQKRIT